MLNEGIINIESKVDDFEILICPFCMAKIPIISFTISDDIIYLHINCFCVKEARMIELEKYYDIFKSSLNKKHACNYNSSHYDQSAMLYCDNCSAWLCNDCLEIHSTKELNCHVLLPREVYLSCKEHKSTFNYYCNNCELNFCNQCKDAHIGHNVIEIKQVSNAPFISHFKIIPEIIKSNKQLKEDMIKMIDNRIFELTKWKEEIEILYHKNTKMNNEFVKLIDLIIKTTNLCQHCPNYAFDNINTNFSIDNNIVTLNSKHSIDENYIITKNHFLHSFLLKINDNCIVKGNNEINKYDDEISNQEYVQSKLVATLEGHTNLIRCLIELNDGRIASSSWDNSIKIWDLTTNKLVCTLEGHSYYVWSIVQLKDGRLASCSGDNTIRIWDLTLYMCMNTITGDSFTFITQLSNGTLVTCSKERIQLWDVDLLECLYTVEGHSKSIWCLIELKDTRLVSCSWDGTIKFWGSNRLNYIETIKASAESINYIIQLNEGTLVSCSDDKSIKEWDVNTYKYIGSFVGHRSWVFMICQLRDSRLVSSAIDKSIRFWDISTYQCIDIIQQNETSELVLRQLNDGRLASCSGNWLNNKTQAVIKIWKVL